MAIKIFDYALLLGILQMFPSQHVCRACSPDFNAVLTKGISQRLPADCVFSCSGYGRHSANVIRSSASEFFFDESPRVVGATGDMFQYGSYFLLLDVEKRKHRVKKLNVRLNRVDFQRAHMHQLETGFPRLGVVDAAANSIGFKKCLHPAQNGVVSSGLDDSDGRPLLIEGDASLSIKKARDVFVAHWTHSNYYPTKLITPDTNNTAAAVSPGAIALNWRVAR